MRWLRGLIVDIEKKLFNIPFGAVGSLYFKTDLPSHLQGPLYAAGTPDEAGDSETYCIGPITDYMFWYGQRAKLELDRGPCMLFFLQFWICYHQADFSQGATRRTIFLQLLKRKSNGLRNLGNRLNVTFSITPFFLASNAPRIIWTSSRSIWKSCPIFFQGDPRLI